MVVAGQGASAGRVTQTGNALPARRLIAANGAPRKGFSAICTALAAGVTL